MAWTRFWTVKYLKATLSRYIPSDNCLLFLYVDANEGHDHGHKHGHKHEDEMPAWKKKAMESGAPDPNAAPFGGNWKTESSISASEKMEE
jgi:hypothetical protein